MNGRPGRRIAHARGLRQGDPLSPMLFVTVMEVLNSLIRDADKSDALTPLPRQVFTHRASLYADDLVILVAPVADDFHWLSEILNLFAGASGLITNFEKCVITPIRCSEAVVAEILEVFPCVVHPFLCKYLGIPLSPRRLNRSMEQPLVNAIATRILTWKAGLLANAGRTLLTKVTLSAMPVHISIACCLS